jgi:hypothetical protein
VLDEVLEAVTRWQQAHRRTDVFAGSQSPRLVIETGVPLQAVVTKELLLSIFNPRSPLTMGRWSSKISSS